MSRRLVFFGSRLIGLSDGGRARVLADGHEIPLLGLGVWQVPEGPCENAVRAALEPGYRHIDTAQAYGNERSVGRALRDSGVPRDEVFVTTKFFPRRRIPRREAERSLERLVSTTSTSTSSTPERRRDVGVGRDAARARARLRALDRRLELQRRRVGRADRGRGASPPVVNQIQFNPFAYRRRAAERVRAARHRAGGLQPAGTGDHLGDDQVGAIAERHGRTPAQVLIRWCVQRDLVVLPKSTHRERIEENAPSSTSRSRRRHGRARRARPTGGTAEARERKWWSS